MYHSRPPLGLLLLDLYSTISRVIRHILRQYKVRSKIGAVNDFIRSKTIWVILHPRRRGHGLQQIVLIRNRRSDGHSVIFKIWIDFSTNIRKFNIVLPQLLNQVILFIAGCVIMGPDKNMLSSPLI